LGLAGTRPGLWLLGTNPVFLCGEEPAKKHGGSMMIYSCRALLETDGLTIGN
jgi:hypothetical protein